MLLKRLRELLVDYTGIVDFEITEETSLKNDLCLNSFDLIQMVAVIEEEFDIEIVDCRIKDIKTVGDVIDIIERSN